MENLDSKLDIIVAQNAERHELSNTHTRTQLVDLEESFLNNQDQLDDISFSLQTPRTIRQTIGRKANELQNKFFLDMKKQQKENKKIELRIMKAKKKR